MIILASKLSENKMNCECMNESTVVFDTRREREKTEVKEVMEAAKCTL